MERRFFPRDSAGCPVGQSASLTRPVTFVVQWSLVRCVTVTTRRSLKTRPSPWGNVIDCATTSDRRRVCAASRASRATMQGIVSISVFSLVIVSTVCGSVIHRRVSRQAMEDDENKPICYAREPCLFVMLSRQSGSDNLFAYREIPTWCKCSEQMVCASHRYDSRKRANIHTCQTPEEVQKREEQKKAESILYLK
uniref:Uncharacterized protein n=1 Tax=Plectus sambesii TaxID=2011161 RepID=A0A914WIG5_9BILA